MSKGFASNYRIVLLTGGLLLCFGGIGVRLVWLHVINRDEFLSYIADKKPSYPECESWVLSKKGGSLDADAVGKLNSAIAGYIHDDATRKAILGESNIEDNGTIKHAVHLNNLDDWKAFHSAVLA